MLGDRGALQGGTWIIDFSYPFCVKMAKDMQMMESTKIIVYSLIWSDGKTDQSDESSNGGQGGRKWSKLIKLTELEIRVPHWTRREGECLDLVDVMLQIAVMETWNKANRGLPLAFELRQIKGTKVLGQILAIKGCVVIKEGKKNRDQYPSDKELTRVFLLAMDNAHSSKLKREE